MVSPQEWRKDEIETVLNVEIELKRGRATGRAHPLKRDRTLAMLFFLTTTRTRSSLEAGMTRLGGQAAFIESETTQTALGALAERSVTSWTPISDRIAILHRDWSELAD
jgi:ornithine carbamoyltransferase